jgi:acylphosphatase
MRTRCYYSGHVQGVGFRYTARRIAAGLTVTGFVRNLDDGRVELVAEGPDAQVEALLAEIRERLGHHIRRVASSDEPPGGERFADFSIR